MIELIKLVAVFMAAQIASLFAYAGITMVLDRLPESRVGLILIGSLMLNVAIVIILFLFACYTGEIR